LQSRQYVATHRNAQKKFNKITQALGDASGKTHNIQILLMELTDLCVNFAPKILVDITQSGRNPPPLISGTHRWNKYGKSGYHFIDVLESQDAPS
jgi:hypothetical protein